MTSDLATGFAPDALLPSRDVLLDPDAVAARLSHSLAHGSALVVDDCRLLRAKYRIGESLRVVYRLMVGGQPQLVTGRAFQRGASYAAFRTASARSSAVGALTGVGLPGVTHDAGLDTVWWTFPNDRRLDDLAAVLSPPADLARLAAGRSSRPWVASEVAEYAPERSLTVRATDVAGETVAYAKAYVPGRTDVGALARRYDHVASGLRDVEGEVSSPRALGWSRARGVLVLEAMTGARWSELAADHAPAALRHLGRAIAGVHQIVPPPGCGPFGRLALSRVRHSAELIARARPDVGQRVIALATRLCDGAPDPERSVLLHGDCHPKNALVTDAGISLLDLDQAGVGDPAADIGSLLARLRHGVVVGERDVTTSDAMEAAFLDGYASLRPLPAQTSLRWHTAAAVVAERMMRAVNRVHRPALAQLDALLSAATHELTARSVA